MIHHHTSCHPDTEPCACKALARNDATWADGTRRHWPSFAAGWRDGRDGKPLSGRGFGDPNCGRCAGTGFVWTSSSVDEGDVDPVHCECW